LEREVLVTGIGGQGVQLAAKILAQAASQDGRSVMMFGLYGGMIRGGPSDSTIVAAEGEILAPPIIDAAWALVALHPGSIPKLLPKIRPGGVVVANSTLCLEPISRSDVSVIAVPATRIAEQAGKIVGASMVALGAFLAATGFASPEAIAAAMQISIPAHRRSLLAFNESCLALGREYVASHSAAPGDARAW
jgi:Pyruvate/2-oxoacid:ferredoxin oxidoreductase gamma subunit